MSSTLPVLSMPPLLKFCETLARFTPLPMLLAPVPSLVAEYTSANSARDDLKPVVLTLAMLLPVTSSCLLAAERPLKPILKDMVHSLLRVGRLLQANGLDFGQSNTAQARQVEHHFAAVLTQGHAADRRWQVGRERRGRATDRRGCSKGVGTAGQQGAGIVLAVPGKGGIAGRLRPHVDGPNHLASG